MVSASNNLSFPVQAQVKHLTVDGHSGQRIDNFLMRELKGIPRSRIYRMLRTGEVRVDGRRVKAGFRLADGQTVRVPPLRVGETAPAPRSPEGLIRLLRDNVMFEDDELLVLDKPSGVAVHGGSGVRLGAIEALRDMFGNPRLELGHRLDRDTSGILLIAKTRPALGRLHAAFRDGEVVKRYQALVAHHWPAGVRSVRLRLRRYTTGDGERRVRVDASGQAARTDVTVARTGLNSTWLHLALHTGRTHQIRVHAAANGCPVLGDEKYASEASRRLAQESAITELCLHARALRLPWGNITHRFESPTPDRFERGWHALEASAPEASGNQ